MQLLQSMSQQIAADGKELPQLQRAIGLPAYSDSFQLSYFGSTEGVMFSVPSANRPADYDPRARGWYKAAQNAPGTIVTEPYIAASSGKLVMTMATPVKFQNQFVGVAGADIALDNVTKIINSLNFDGHGYAFLVSADGKILVHPDSKLVLKNISEAYPTNTPKIATGVTEIDSGKSRRSFPSRLFKVFRRPTGTWHWCWSRIPPTPCWPSSVLRPSRRWWLWWW